MTLPKRAKTIVVDGEEFRWLVTSGRHERLTLTVEPTAKPGALMQVDYIDRAQLYRRGADGAWEPTRQGRRIGPDFVSDCITLAIVDGWDRTGNGVWKLREHGGWEVVSRLIALHPTDSPADDETPIVRLAWDALNDLMFTISVDYDWRALIKESGPDASYPIDPQLLHPRHRELELSFECFSAGWDDGWYFIGIRCVELPQVEAASFNNPAVR